MTILKALAELAGLFLVAQGVLYLLAGPKRDLNVFYQLLKVLTGPAVRLVRRVTPRVVIDRHIPFVTFVILAWLWLMLLVAKAQICSELENRCVPEVTAWNPVGCIAAVRRSGYHQT